MLPFEKLKNLRRITVVSEHQLEVLQMFTDQTRPLLTVDADHIDAVFGQVGNAELDAL